MKWYTNLKIKSKLILGFLVLSIIAALVGGFGMLTIVQIKAKADLMYQENAMALQYAGSAAMKTQAVVSSAQSLAKLDTKLDHGVIVTNSERMTQDIADVDNLLKNIDSVVKSDIKSGSLRDIMSNWSSLKTYLTSVASYMQKQDGAEMADSAIRPAMSVSGSLTDGYNKLLTQVSDDASKRAAENNSQEKMALIIMGSVLVVAIVLSLILGYSLAKGIGNPLKLMAAAGMRIADGDVKVDDIMTEKDRKLADRKDEIGALAKMVTRLITGAKNQSEEAKLVAEGDLTVEIDLKSDRDVLGLSLRELVENFHNMAQSIVQAASKVTLGSESVANSSIVLSQGATEQASAIEELNATIEVIAKQTELNAENAAKANELAQKAKENAEAGNRQMKDMLAAMEEISEASKNINKVIKVIDDIAFQTNILALNAAVEAARAGQAGKGFAVVAEEVRALAAKSANAVKDTAGLIESSIRKVAAGTKIANDTADALNEILVQVEKSAELVGAINTASREQEYGIQQVEQGIAQVSQVVQTNAATAQESAAASEELSKEAAQLKQYVNVFKLHDSGGMSSDWKTGAVLDDEDYADAFSEEDTPLAIAASGYGKY